MPKKVIDKREYWLDDNRHRIVIEGTTALIIVPHLVSLDNRSMSMAALKKLWELLELVANDEWKAQPAKEQT